jgi:hypothetical protein
LLTTSIDHISTPVREVEHMDYVQQFKDKFKFIQAECDKLSEEIENFPVVSAGVGMVMKILSGFLSNPYTPTYLSLKLHININHS